MNTNVMTAKQIREAREKVQRIAKEDYDLAQKLGFTRNDRWEKGIDHHPMSVRLMRFLEKHDFEDYDDHFCWKIGGDGDNGESLMYEMDAFFEMLDAKQKTASQVSVGDLS